MSGVKVIRNLLVNNAGITALVGTNVIAGVVPQGTVLPAIAITEVSSTERHTARLSGPVLVTSRVQVSVLTKTYPSQKAILAAVGAAITTQSGTVQGVNVDSILRDIVGPDMVDTDMDIYMQTRDFIVKFHEAH